MPRALVRFEVQDPQGARQPLQGAWVYWQEGRTRTVLRTDQDGLVRALTSGQDASRPWSYGQPFYTQLGSQVEVYYSLGARPLPDACLDEQPSPLLRRTAAVPPPAPLLPIGPGGAPVPVPIPVAPNDTNTVVVVPVAVMTLPAHKISLTRPTELSLWPVLWELPGEIDLANPGRPCYPTAGLTQGSALWAGNSLNTNIVENAPAAAPPDSVTHQGTAIPIRLRDRGLLVQGTTAGAATRVRVRLMNLRGEVVELRADINPNSEDRTEVVATLQPQSGGTRRFEASVFLRYEGPAASRTSGAHRFFGPLQIIVNVEQGTPEPWVESFSVQLCGCQINLCEDPIAGNGAQRGPATGEADERIIVDFASSPAATRAALSNGTRQRRMVPFEIHNQQRPLDLTQPAGNTNPRVLRPQMPMWMADLALLGLTRQHLQDLMARRFYRQHVTTSSAVEMWFWGAAAQIAALLRKPPSTATVERTTTSLTMRLIWEFILSWSGPDVNASAFPATQRSNQRHDYVHLVRHEAEVRMRFNQDGALVDSSLQPVAPGADGVVPGAFVQAPAAIPFPVTGRRRPQVILSTAPIRTWGRRASAPAQACFLVEFQPRIVDAAGAEIIRGGDGQLRLVSLSIDGVDCAAGAVPAGQGEPMARLPRFRVKGTNPAPHADVVALIDRLVSDCYNANAAQARTQVLSLACWQTTARLIFQHENGGDAQFETRPSHVRRPILNGACYGCQLDMPLFGPPHGYGFGQLDFIFHRGANEEEVWSFLENLRSAVRLIMEEKAGDAYQHLSPHFPPLAQQGQLHRAIYQREIVRRYNGGREFSWNGTAWVISPSLSQTVANTVDGSANATVPNPSLLYPNHVLPDVVYYTRTANGITTANSGTGAPPGQPAVVFAFPWPIQFLPAHYGPDTA